MDLQTVIVLVSVCPALIVIAVKCWRYMRSPEVPAAALPRTPWADDPIARSIDWTGTSDWTGNPKGGPLRMRAVSDSRVEFRPAGAGGFHVVMNIFGVAAGVLIYIDTSSIPMALLAPLAFIGMSIGVRLLQRLNEPFVFDKGAGSFLEGRVQPMKEGSAKRHGRIADIHALQLVNAWRWVGNPAAGAASDYKQFNVQELNLVMKDGARLSVARCDGLDGLEGDARGLATFLGRPLWDRR